MWIHEKPTTDGGYTKTFFVINNEIVRKDIESQGTGIFAVVAVTIITIIRKEEAA